MATVKILIGQSFDRSFPPVQRVHVVPDSCLHLVQIPVPRVVLPKGLDFVGVFTPGSACA